MMAVLHGDQQKKAKRCESKGNKHVRRVETAAIKKDGSSSTANTGMAVTVKCRVKRKENLCC